MEEESLRAERRLDDIAVRHYRAYIDAAVRHVLMRQGVLGVKVSIMLPHDATGKTGPKEPLADVVTILEPKEEAPAPAAPTFEDGLQKPPAAQPGY